MGPNAVHSAELLSSTFAVFWTHAARDKASSSRVLKERGSFAIWASWADVPKIVFTHSSRRTAAMASEKVIPSLTYHAVLAGLVFTYPSQRPGGPFLLSEARASSAEKRQKSSLVSL